MSSYSTEGLAPTADDPVDETELTDANGVDLTLVRYTLDLSPTERLKRLEDFVNTLASATVVRRAAGNLGARSRKP